jgi:hypothetical protein
MNNCICYFTNTAYPLSDYHNIAISELVLSADGSKVIKNRFGPTGRIVGSDEKSELAELERLINKYVLSRKS